MENLKLWSIIACLIAAMSYAVTDNYLLLSIGLFALAVFCINCCASVYSIWLVLKFLSEIDITEELTVDSTADYT